MTIREYNEVDGIDARNILKENKKT